MPDKRTPLQSDLDKADALIAKARADLKRSKAKTGTPLTRMDEYAATLEQTVAQLRLELKERLQDLEYEHKLRVSAETALEELQDTFAAAQEDHYIVQQDLQRFREAIPVICSVRMIPHEVLDICNELLGRK